MEKVTITMSRKVESSFSLPKDMYENVFKNKYENLKSDEDVLELFHEMQNSTWDMPDEYTSRPELEVA